MINLDYQSRVPIYKQIIQEIERFVALGILKPEQQIPSIRDMASQLGINPNTVKKAYSILESKGVIVTLSTKGTYIGVKTDEAVENTVNEKIIKIQDLVNELNRYGITKEEIIKKVFND